MMRLGFCRRFFLCGLLLLLCACQKQEPVQKSGKTGLVAPPVAKKEEPVQKSGKEVGLVAPPAAITLGPVLKRPAQIAMYESPAELLPEAVRLRGGTLVLFADNPWLAPVPDALRNEIGEVLAGKDVAHLSSRLKSIPNPLVLPIMTIRAGLISGLFQRLIWVVPTANQQEPLDLEKFKEFLKSAEIDSKTFRVAANGTLSGTVEGVEFDVVHSAALPELNGPVLLHFDLGYFVTQYKNEIKTPLVPLVGATLLKLRGTKWPVAGVTFSYSNHSGHVPLSMRPLGRVVQRLFAEPQLLDQSMPENWDLWGKTLYLESFFQSDEIQSLLMRMEKNAPNDAGVKYLISRFSRHKHDFVGAERYLSLAVVKDREYALDYLEQSEEAREQKKPEQILANLRRLVKAFPDDPIFQLSLCEELVTQHHFDEARKILSELRKLPWSPVYYSDVLSSLEYFQKIADQ